MAFTVADGSSNSTKWSFGMSVDRDPEKRNQPPKQSMWHRLGLCRLLLGRDDRAGFGKSRSRTWSRDDRPRSSPARTNHHDPDNVNVNGDGEKEKEKEKAKRRSSSDSNNNRKIKNDKTDGNNSSNKSHDSFTQRLSRKVGVGHPRAATSKRQDSERRDRLSPVDRDPRRAVSADRLGGFGGLDAASAAQRSNSPPPSADPPRVSAPEIQWFDRLQPMVEEPLPIESDTRDDVGYGSECETFPPANNISDQARSSTSSSNSGRPGDALSENVDIESELDGKWILNLSMHFRDRSEREKFFVTYAETPNRWRRVTISCDYRNAPLDSLETDLKELRYQRTKCARIYEAIRESLPDIQFYDTVTNLKLETRDGRLHVHVTEDVNEIIPYPPISCVGHLTDAVLIPERHIHFETHLSGFVYKVRTANRELIKKDIPGPDTVDEFLYEINALHALGDSPNVIHFEGIVVDDRRQIVKGLLINFASKGALVDILYEYKGEIEWERRERWAQQIVHGLSQIHESGYVQGDFTVSNVVVDEFDDAKIIDINRRGCPVGWEPPEIAAKIESNQRISMYIGVKTDLYQLGMTLWALAMEEDEPERQVHPLVFDANSSVPQYYQELVATCLSPAPRQRLSAKELLSFFPRRLSGECRRDSPHDHGTETSTVVRDGGRAEENSFDSVSNPPERHSEGQEYYSSMPDSLDGDGYSSSQNYSTSQALDESSYSGQHSYLRPANGSGSPGASSECTVSESQDHSSLVPRKLVPRRDYMYEPVDDHVDLHTTIADHIS